MLMSNERHGRIRARASLVSLLAAGSLACRPEEAVVLRLERDLLLREKEALEREAAGGGADVEDAAALVVVPATLVDQLIAVALPVQATIDDRFRITADSAHVDFRGGLALVRLAARVEWVDRENVSARIDVLGVLQVLDIEAGTGRLTSRVEILGFETSDVRVGSLAPPASRLLDALAERPAGDLNELLSRIEIPVRLAPTIRLPAVEEDEISIAGADIALEARIQKVRVGAGRLWVYIALGVPGPDA
jgi:hypothetical protein